MTQPDAGGLAERAPSGPTAEGKKGGAGRLALAFVLAPILLTLLWGVATRLTTTPAPREALPTVAMGYPAPDFTFPTLGGKGNMSLSGQRGKVVLLNVWATWCVPCLEEMPSLQRLYTIMKEKGEPLEILAVSIDALGKDAVQEFVDRFGLTFPILLDPRGEVKKLYRTTGVPETFIIDPGGKLAQKIIGSREWDSPQVLSYLRQVMLMKPEKKSAS